MKRKYHKSKVDIVFGILSTGIYRPWFWQHYPRDRQEALRLEWAKAVSRFSEYEIRAGLGRWINERGVDNPPSPSAFAAFMSPAHNSSSREFFRQVRDVLIQ